MGLTQALATERNARVKDREAYTVPQPTGSNLLSRLQAELQQAVDRPRATRSDGSFEEVRIVGRLVPLTEPWVVAGKGGQANDPTASGTRT